MTGAAAATMRLRGQDERVTGVDLWPRISVVVPTIGRRQAGLQRTLGALLAQQYPDFEVIVVDNRPGVQGPALALPSDERVRLAAERRPGISAARNKGTALAAGEVVAFTDDDAVPAPGWLAAIGACMGSHPEVDGVGGPVVPADRPTTVQMWFEQFYGGFSRGGSRRVVSLRAPDGDPLFPYAPASFGAGCNMAFRRSALAAVGGFDPALGTGTPARGGEDLAMFITLLSRGAALAYEPEAVVRHAHRATRQEFLRQVAGYGTGLTAMYTSLVVHDPRHLGRLAKRLPAGARRLASVPGRPEAAGKGRYPRRALAYQVGGMLYGPIAYACSRLVLRRRP